MRLFRNRLAVVACLVTALLAGTSDVASAQSSRQKIQFGLKGGANFSQLSGLHYDLPRLTPDGIPVMSGGKVVYDFFQQNDARTTGIVGGIFARFGNHVFIQPELLVSAKGGKMDVIRQGLETQTANVRLTTVDMPLLLGLRLGPLRVNAGPMASLTVAESGTLKDTFKQYTTQSLSRTAKQATVTFQAGVGLSLGGMQLDLRHEGSFADMRSLVTKAPTDNEKFTSRTGLWQLTVGFGL